MRFTWVALPILLTAIGPAAPAASAVQPLEDDDARRVAALAAQGEDLAVSSPFARRGVQLPESSELLARRIDGETPADEESEETSTAVSAEPRLRQVGIAWLEFHTHLAHALSGFLPSYSTACPPPAAA